VLIKKSTDASLPLPFYVYLFTEDLTLVAEKFRSDVCIRSEYTVLVKLISYGSGKFSVLYF